MRPPKSDVCVLCGIRPATTSDHVPPKGLFKGLHAQLITVPACADCNNGASADDEDFRFYISVQVGKQTPGSATLWDSGAYPSIKRKSSLRNNFNKSSQKVVITDSSGNQHARTAFEIPARTYDAVFSRITRGLYFHHTGNILPQDTPIAVLPLNGIPDISDQEFQPLQRNSIGGDACTYRFGLTPDNPKNGLWLFSFYRTLWVLVNTGDVAVDMINS